MIKAEIIADSLNEFGNRLTTFVCVFPRIVLSEFNTHRMLSRNSASSRAIPFEKMVKMVEENPFIPIKWMKEHKGMQGSEYFTNTDSLPLGSRNIPYTEMLEKRWLASRDSAVNSSKGLSKDGLTKQICNRLLEPFMWHTVIVTGSEWENFFTLRAHPAAEIHIADLAEKMLVAYNDNVPKQLKAGEWHIPFGDKITDKWDEFEHVLYNGEKITWAPEGYKLAVVELKIKIATARCARVSYLNFEGKDDYQADVNLHDNLIRMGHFSPTEHCAKAMSKDEYNSYLSGDYGVDWETRQIVSDGHGFCGNFRGFIQYRKMLEGENKKDLRVKIK